MRLTLINQFYPPDLAPTGHLLASLAEHRAKLGDRITVITSQGGYVPQVRDRPPPAFPGLRILRLWTPKLGKGSIAKRLVDYALFALQAGVYMLFMRPQDVIISLTTPPYIAWIAALHKLLHPNTKVVLWSMDCYPEVLERADTLSPSSPLSRMMRWLNRQLFSRLDHAVCLDSAMEELLISQYVSAGQRVRTSVISNWEPLELYTEKDDAFVWAPLQEPELASKFVVLYLGNAGFGHRFETVVEAAEQLQQENAAFVFVGGGESWQWLENAKEARVLDNMHLFHYVPKEITPSVMGLADCALITLRDAYLGVISPSKLHSSLAMGLPIAYVGPEGSNVDEAIRRFDCGISLRHGDVQGLVGYIRRLMQNPEEQEMLSRQARNAFETAYTDTVGLGKFDRLLDGLVSDH